MNKQITPDELFDQLAELPLEKHDRCPLCRDQLDRTAHAFYLAMLETADEKNAVKDDQALEEEAVKRLPLSSRQMHKRIIRCLLTRTWKDEA